MGSRTSYQAFDARDAAVYLEQKKKSKEQIETIINYLKNKHKVWCVPSARELESLLNSAA